MKFPFLSKRITPLFPIVFILGIMLILMIALIPPTFTVILPFFSFSILYLVFPLIFLLAFGVGTLVFKSRFHGFLLATFIVIFLLLRLSGLKHPLFAVLLLALFITLEFFFAQSGKKHTPLPSARKDQVKKQS